MGGTPETLYARDGDVYLAYQVVGDRGPDLLFVPGPNFPIDLIWDEPTVAGHLRRLASFSRLILTDILGAGSSDAVPIRDNPAMQSWTDGLVAVLDAVGSEHVSVFAMTGVRAACHDAWRPAIPSASAPCYSGAHSRGSSALPTIIRLARANFAAVP